MTLYYYIPNQWKVLLECIDWLLKFGVPFAIHLGEKQNGFLLRICFNGNSFGLIKVPEPLCD